MRKGEDVSDVLYETLGFSGIQTAPLSIQERVSVDSRDPRLDLWPPPWSDSRRWLCSGMDFILFQCMGYTGTSGKAFCTAEPTPPELSGVTGAYSVPSGY